MPTDNFQMQTATAYPGMEPVPSSKGVTLKTEILTAQGRKDAHIKPIGIEDIAREAICAVLAQKLHLPVSQPYYVYVEPAFIGGHGIGGIHNIAFGLEADRLPSFRLTRHQLNGEIPEWPEALRLAIFDEWIYNRNRFPNNLIFAGKRRFQLTGHESALPNYASPSACSESPLLQMFANYKSEFELYTVRKRAMEYVGQYQSLDWSEIHRLLLPDALPGSGRLFRKHAAFLTKRIDNMRDIISQTLRIAQTELRFRVSDSSATGKAAQQ